MTQDNPTPTESHYFSADPQGVVRRHQFTLPSARGDLQLVAESGVFAKHGLDKGTEVLLDTMRRYPISPPSPGTHLCDVGCGSGAIALTLATAFPECVVHAVDVNERAQKLCAENAERNGISNIVVTSPHDVDPSIQFAAIWSNPPIRIGKNELHDLLTLWLSRLLPDGHADIVVNKNLGADSLAQWITAQGYVVTRLASSKGFRVLDISRTN